MIVSMTGFGRGLIQNDTYTVTVEMKAVNHRFSDISVKMPKPYFLYEEKIKKVAQKYFGRGKIDIFITIDGKGFASRTVEVDWQLIEQYVRIFEKANNEYDTSDKLSLNALLDNTDIFHIQEHDHSLDDLENAILEATEKSAIALLEMRKQEGRILYNDFLTRLLEFDSKISLLMNRAGLVIQAFQERLQKKIAEILDGKFDIDEGRILTEVAIYADKSDITEELERLKSHVAQFKQSLRMEVPVGRKLDFIVQEMNREINTIGSKSNDIVISQTVVDLKSDLEKIKEQSQNIE